MANKLLLFLFPFISLLQLSLQQGPECSATKLCAIGCCSKSGYCGTGPDFCGTGCQSTCDFKADCNPGWDSKWSKEDKCPLNVCCSKFGFCGTTKEFCGDKTVSRPSCSASSTPINRVIGYYEAWSTTNRDCYGMMPEEVPFGYYTDIIFSFATIDPNTFEIGAGDSQTAEFMKRISTIKLIQPDIKVWIAVGGWAFNDPGPTQKTFSDMAASSSATHTFINSLNKMMNTYGFDGIDIDWEYPGADDRAGKDADYKNFVTFMKMLSEDMRGGGKKKGVSLTLPSSFWYLKHFDIKNLEEYVDWFNVMSYDLHGSWDIDNKWTGPFANSHTNMTEIQDALDLLWRNDIKPEKVTVGMSFYSRSFTLQNASCNKAKCAISSGGNPGKCSVTTGVLLHPEIADIIKEKSLSPVLDRDAGVMTVTWDDQWTTYDDVTTWRLKANMIRGQCISNVMVWAISQDDKDNTNIKALTSAIGRKQLDPPKFTPATKPQADTQTLQPAELCRWSGCFQDCPSGFKAVQRENFKEVMLTTENCPKGHMDKFCCPSNSPMPVCAWRGHKNSGKCKPGCNNDEVKVGSLGIGCSGSHQAACCTSVASTSAYGQCKWVGDAPTCNDSCPTDFPHQIFSTKRGSGGEQSCNYGFKHYCCKNPIPAAFSKCGWYSSGKPLSGGPGNQMCEDSCPDGQIKLATRAGSLTDDVNDCISGASAYCCEPEKAPQLTPRGDDDPFGGKQNKEFQLLLEKYMENPTCPATILHPKYGNMFTDTDFSKRSLEHETAELRVLQRRATDCTSDNWVKMIAFASVMLTISSNMLEPLQLVYDDLFADSFDEDLKIANLRSYYGAHSALDPNTFMQYIFLNPTAAGPGLRRAAKTSELFCYDFGDNAKRDVETEGDSTSLSKRGVWWLPTVSAGTPDASKILSGILNGDIVLNYARWQYLANQHGPMLELAYWIGSTVGTAGTDNSYRDLNLQGTGDPDRWVVFHFHIDDRRQFLRLFDGRTHVGIASVQIFHGYASYVQANKDWRVDGFDSGATGRNVRDGFACYPRNRAAWFPGTTVNLPVGTGTQNDATFYDLFQRWGESLYRDGYLSSVGISLVLKNSGTLANGDIDPANPGTMLGSNDQHPTYNALMYSYNFVITAGQIVYGAIPRIA